ncbi:succinylglutamate desuccinylase/aspartoacylase family protein [Maribacter sp. SA7]|uniref:succinylglutamate desuccinylase/aspartoacylase family protein n=1 Tax=Maribacter zhoushanensis TaxID=3030012 RepID=UPI0023ED2E07|nr:succinylglutamate desuccinylase/aspartoacylase family protein [Maribacter zhoushanensis]MDF4203388.1 succinylglutamate desuccinylase/aspartoacylase family protein [Maribacter zhoushanensis]
MSKLLSSLFIFFSLSTALAQNNFNQVFSNATRPSKDNIRIEFQDSRNNKVFLPISILKGKNEGPVFTVVAGVHGFEYPPIVGVQELLREINMDSLNGTLIIIPIANTSSFFSRTSIVNPYDRVNLNGAFPGKSSGSVTQKIADFITNTIIPVSDVFLDIHGGGVNEDLIPFALFYDNQNYPEQTKKARELTEISGFEYIVSYPFTLKDNEPAKYVFKQASQDGKIALSFESGKLGNVQKDAVSFIKNGVYNMLNNMDMYDKGTAPHANLIQLNNPTYISATETGLFYSDHKAGYAVKKGDVVGYITNEFGEKLNEYTTHASGIILYKISTPPVNVDDTLFCISSSL